MRNLPNTSIEFTNRRGNIYYVKSKLTKKGNTTYYMTKKKDEDCLNSLPDKYEVFEKPDTGVLYIRQKKEKMFDWAWIDGGEDLQDMVRRNIYHLGRMSYYEL